MNEILYVTETVVGIGLLIFLHELGHFLAARWAGVRVDAFSLGFGPVLLARQRGATEYRLSLIPIGGYVKLAGELPSEDNTGAPDELCSKSVGIRAFIFSAGVLTNILVALILFPVLFYVGVPFVEPVIGDVSPGGLAWKAGLRPGTKVLEVDGSPVYGFEHVLGGVALGSREGTRLLVETPEGKKEEVVLRTGSGGPDALEILGIEAIPNRALALAVDPKGPAARAGVRDGDRLVSVNGEPVGFPNLSPFERAIAAGEALDLEVRRGEETVRFRVAPEPTKAKGRQLGVFPPTRRILAVRENPALGSLDLHPGDVIVSVDRAPLFLSEELKDLLAAPGDHAIRALRGEERQERSFVLPDAARQAFLTDIAFGLDVGVAEVVPQRDSPAARAGLMPGDRILQVGSTTVGDFRQFAQAVRESEGPELALQVRRGSGDEAEVLSLVATPLPLRSHGLGVPPSYYTYQTRDLLQAGVVGFRCSLKMVEDVYLTLKRMLTRELSSKHLGGILTIGGTAYKVSQLGFSKLLFFLALLSINLAILNILPIPILDGGHLLFLLVEKLKGSPVSERVLGYSQIVGLVLLLSLMVFATYNDIRNLFWN